MYEVMIDNFNGPLDLLLHLIKKEKMDIFDVKLEIIINEYLDYIEKMQEMDLDVASSYLVMASELLEIKSRMLLPSIKEEEEEEDPKERLLNRLVEYEKYKNQVDVFKELENLRSNYYTKTPSNLDEYLPNDSKKDFNVNLDDLVEAFKKAMERVNLEKPLHTKVTKKELSVDDSIKSIRKKINKGQKVNFLDLFENYNKEYVIVTFLAVLEMVSHGELRIIQENNFDNIMCEGV